MLAGMIYVFSLGFGLGLPLFLAYAFHSTLNIGMGYTWLLALNLCLMALMGKDKLAAHKRWRRTPEVTLLVMTFLGGTPALFAGRKLFRHKTTKQEFLYAMWGTLAAQVGCIVYFWNTLKGWF